MALLDDIAAAGWAYPTRTLRAFAASPPTNGLEDITAAIWDYFDRDLAVINPSGEVAGTFTATARVDGLFENVG